MTSAVVSAFTTTAGTAPALASHRQFGGQHPVFSVQAAPNLHWLTHAQRLQLTAANHETGPKKHDLRTQLQLSAAETVDIALQNNRAGFAQGATRGLQHQLLRLQALTIPRALHPPLLTRGRQDLVRRPRNRCATQAQATHAIWLDQAQRLGHLGRSRGKHLNPRGAHLTAGEPVTAHPHPIAGLQWRQVGHCQDPHTLAQHTQHLPIGIDGIDRTHHRIEYFDVLRPHFGAGSLRTHRHQLAHSQFVQRRALSIALHWRVGFDFNLNPVDTHAGKTSDHTHDTGAAHAGAFLRHLPRTTDATWVH